MDFEERTLEEWLVTRPKKEFPAGQDYPARYAAMTAYLGENVHPLVTIGATVTDGGLLTDHGPKHIATVIDRVTKLVRAPGCTLTAYEAYLLLTAVHFHDVGNILGRKEHEINSREILKKLDLVVGTTPFERRWIWNIAKTHGGNPKDKLSKLPVAETIMSEPVRVQLLAAILKLADELTDEASRAANFLNALGTIPKQSEVYHRYAEALHSVHIDLGSRDIQLHFQLDRAAATEKLGKGNDEVFLLDEIYERTMKTHLERLFCMRFMRSYIPLDSVSVKIEFFDENFDELHAPIKYRLEEQGYPDAPMKGIYDLCSTELYVPGSTTHLDGALVKAQIEAQTQSS